MVKPDRRCADGLELNPGRWKMKRRIITAVLGVLMLGLIATSCGTITGAAVGAGTGAAIGAGTHYGAKKGALVGAGAGAAAGAVYDIVK